MTWYEYSLVITHHIISNAREWGHTRAIEYILYCANTMDKPKKSPHEIRPLITDKTEPPEPVSEEDKDELFRIAEERARFLPK